MAWADLQVGNNFNALGSRATIISNIYRTSVNIIDAFISPVLKNPFNYTFLVFVLTSIEEGTLNKLIN